MTTRANAETLLRVSDGPDPGRIKGLVNVGRRSITPLNSSSDRPQESGGIHSPKRVDAETVVFITSITWRCVSVDNYKMFRLFTFLGERLALYAYRFGAIAAIVHPLPIVFPGTP